MFLSKKEGEFNDSFLKAINALADGNYLVTIRVVNSYKDVGMFRNEYFALCGRIRDYTGENIQDIHTRFKEERNLSSTRDLTIEQWQEQIDALRWWAYEKLDLVI